MNERRTRTPFFTVFLLLLLAAAPVAAQLSIVRLKDGKTVEGFLVSNDGKSVKVETPEGKTLSFLSTNVEVVEETKRWGDADLDAEYAKLDTPDAGGLADLAETAKGKGNKVWTRLADAALKLDKENEKANTLLGYEKIGEKWFKNKKEAEEARKKVFEEKMKAEGKLKVGSGDKAGWITKEEKPGYDKEPKKYMKDESGLYRRIEDVMREQGKEFIKGEWVRAASAEDKADCAAFKQEFETDVIGLSSNRFRIFSTEHTAKQVDEYLVLAEKNHAWFCAKVGREIDEPLFPNGARGQIWLLKDKRAFDKFVNKWGTSHFGMSADWVAFVTRPGGGGGTTVGLTAIHTVENQDDSGTRASVVHGTSHMLISWFVRAPIGFQAPAWLLEGWAHYAEQYFTGIGQIACTTKAYYGAGGGISDKKFTTKDAKDHCKGMVLDGSDDVFENISKKELNSLNGDDLAKAYTIIDWLMTVRPKDFVTFMSSMKTGDEKQFQIDALKAGFGWDYLHLDGEWRKWVKAKY